MMFYYFYYNSLFSCDSTGLPRYHAATLPAMSPDVNHIYIGSLLLFPLPLPLSLALDPRIKAHFYEIKCKPLPPSEVYLDPSHTSPSLLVLLILQVLHFALASTFN
jgi:hypothetical protein